MAHITLNKKNFFHNLDAIAAKTQSIKKIAIVLKDNAYGHGLLEVAKMAQEYGITKAVVQYESEAREIYEYFEYILVLADIPKNADKKIRYTINDINTIKEFPKDTLVELKVNTGMNRNGIEISEKESALTLIKTQGLSLEALFTHYACADELDGVYEMQKERFSEIKATMPQGLHFHSCNSAGLFRELLFDEDMVRVGIAAYGCMELPTEIEAPKLKPVLSLYAEKISSRTLKKGESVGYGATFCADEEMIVSNYDIGYGDGFMRILSSNYSTAEGVKLLGRISMDNSSFASNAEQLLIFNDAKKLSNAAQTISYEILTSLKSNLKRSIV